MRTHKVAGRSSGGRRVKSRARRTVLICAALTVAVGLGVGAHLARGREPDAGTRPAVALAAEPGFGALNGRWQRLDGGYVLEIDAVDGSDAIDAVYLNPQPVNVARAEATREQSALRVFVELRAPGYPGSTYTLRYDRERDRLEGVYLQAALQQRFDVVFVRDHALR